ncbi:MAG: glycosyltransferase family 4 protein [Acidobacteriota bacterium]
MSFSPSQLKVGYVLKVFPRLSETFILNEILELERQGVEVEIFSLKPPTDSRFHGRLSSLRAGVTYLPRADSSATWRAIRNQSRSLPLDAASTGAAFLRSLRSSNPSEWKHLLQALWLASTVQSHGIDHLHAHFATSATRVALMTHMLSGTSFSFTAHAKDIYHRDTDTELLAEALNLAAFAVTVTDHNVTRLASCSPSAGPRIHRIYNGVRVGEYRVNGKFADDPPLILSVGRLVEKKGFPYLLEACGLLKERGHRFRCLIIGTGAKEKELHDQIGKLELADRVELGGPRSHESVIEAISQCDLMVLPCIVGEDGNRDALPTVLLEAIALGRPVVSTDLAGVTEIVDHGQSGLLVPQRDGVALAGAIQQLLSDPELRSALGSSGRRKAERLFDLTRNVGELATLFRESVVGRAGLAISSGRGS